MDPARKAEIVANYCNLDKNEFDLLRQLLVRKDSPPLDIATNFVVNESEYLVPMVTEEPSVVAAASYGAKLARNSGGFSSKYDGSIMVGQIQIVNVRNFKELRSRILQNKKKLLRVANSRSQYCRALDLDISSELYDERMLTASLFVDTKDAMGANRINDMLEYIGADIEKIVPDQGKCVGKILSNYSPYRTARASVKIRKEDLDEGTADNIIHLQLLAEKDPYRAVTHNKGIMNGVDAVLTATCNDTRAVEAANHAWASRSGKYQPLSSWEKNDAGDLEGTAILQMPVGIVGGTIQTYEQSKLSMKILGVKTVDEFANVVASVGLGNNLSALRAIASEGIQKGHMKIHSKVVSKLGI